jgi:glycosyltransferase involved in cell wall biosynthesis
MPSVQPQSRAAAGSIGSAAPVLDRSGQANEKGLRLEREAIGHGTAPFFQRVPRALDLPDPGRLFTPEQLGRKLKVLFIVSQPTGSPAISVHANLMRFFDRDRIEVHVLYNRRADGEPFQSDGTSSRLVLPSSEDIHLRAAEFGPVRGAPSRALLTSTARSVAPALRDAVGLLRYIRLNGIDVVHCEKGPRNGLYGLLLSRLTRARYVAHFHWKYGNWMSRISRFAVRRADAIIAVSSWTGRPIHVAGVPREHIFPVLNGIDVSAWDPATVDGDAVRREFGVPPGDTLVVMVAQLVAWKRQAMLIEAFRRVVAERPRTRLLLVGKELAPRNAGAVSYTEQLQRLVAEAGLEGQVVLTGRRRDVPEILAAADIFALPSVGDPCALAHIEAMAMAKPIVTVESGGAPELVEHGKAGLVGPVDDVEMLAANLIALIDDPVKRRELGDYGRRRVVEYLNAQRMADEVEAVYRLMVNGGSA